MIDYKIIGKRIKECRVKSKLTQEELAEKLKISSNYLSKAENGKEHPNLEMLSKISIHINSSLPYLLAGVVEESADYLNNEFIDVLSSCSAEKKRLIYDVSLRISQFNFEDKDQD